MTCLRDLRAKRAFKHPFTSIIVLCGTVACSAAKAPSESAPDHSEGSSSEHIPLGETGREGGGVASTPLNAAPSKAVPLESQKVAPKDEAPLFPDGVFPPPDPGAPFEKSKHEGDGTYRFMFEDAPDVPVEKRIEGELDPGFGTDFVRRLVIHPHQASRFFKLTVAAFDLRKLALGHGPGAQDVLDVNHPELEPTAGLVPKEKWPGLVAVFNEGFQPKHGRWGMLSGGVLLVPPREDGCTFAVLADGTARVGSWPSLRDDDRIIAYRQAPPCLVAEGELHPKLLAGDRKPWAGQQKDLKTRRRSAVGLSKDGRTLFYALGTETEPEVLAAGMKHIGAHFAAQLDINWNWTRLFFFEEKEGEVRPVGALEEHMAKDKGEYIYRPGKRGFFYLVRR
jgi:hypothetical protein